MAGDGSEGGPDGRRLELISRDRDWGVGPDGVAADENYMFMRLRRNDETA
jgi:hypothetical protein